MVLLLSDLCLERNFTAINKLQKLYTYEQCIYIIRNKKDYDLPLRNAFTRLITHLWIDTKLIQLNLPNRIRVWNEMENLEGEHYGDS